jgi:hypothetical protein
MQQAVRTFVDVIDQWPSIMAMAEDLEEKPSTVSKWRQRNRIPPEHWRLLVQRARRRRYPIDEVKLVEIAARKPS